MKSETVLRIIRIKNNEHLRRILKPVVDLKRDIGCKLYSISDESKQVAALKNKYYGESCYIVGNGPSLTISDLELLKDKYTFAANLIYTLFDKTNWRPAFYLCVDLHAYKLMGNKLQFIDAENLFYLSSAKKYIRKAENKNIYYLYLKSPFLVSPGGERHPIISEDVSKMVNDGRTVTFTSIQLAIYMGFKKIYLIGVDHNYARKMDKNGNITIDPNQKTYAEGMADSGIGIQYIDATTEAYQQAQKYCETHDVKIYNATRGGCLEVFPRVKLEDTLQPGK